ncbi:MAG: hypothetical protein ACR2PA_11825 [Hyphomicrobiaceae bacterium]
MTTLLIDQSGDVWDANAPQLRRQYGAPLLSQSFPDFLVRNAGFASLAVAANGCIVRASPGRLQYATFVALLAALEDHRPHRISLCWFDGAWHRELYATNIEPSTAIFGRQLFALMIRLRDKDGRQFRFEPRPLDNLPSRHPLAHLIDKWRANAEAVEPGIDREVINTKASGKFLIVRHDPADSRLKFTEFGPGWEIYQDRSWLEKCVDQPVEDQPDIQYGRWIANFYRNAMLTNQPTLSDVDVVVRDIGGGTEKRIRYTRLTLPMKSASGEKLLLSTPHVDPSIDLGSQALVQSGHDPLR